MIYWNFALELIRNFKFLHICEKIFIFLIIPTLFLLGILELILIDWEYYLFGKKVKKLEDKVEENLKELSKKYRRFNIDD